MGENFDNKTDRQIIGRLGEDAVAARYAEMGFSVVARNLHVARNEIDLILQSEIHLVFVEVKTRNLTSLGTPADAVDYRKQKKLVLTAMKYLTETESYKQPRFDVLELWQQGGRIVRYNLIENAFSAEDFGGQYEIF